jgi:hypothetical protein
VTTLNLIAAAALPDAHKGLLQTRNALAGGGDSIIEKRPERVV